MTIETRFVKNESDEIITRRFTQKFFHPKDRRKRISAEFFSFKTETVVTTAAGDTRTVKATRNMSAGLFDYFLSNGDFKALVLLENQELVRQMFFT